MALKPAGVQGLPDLHADQEDHQEHVDPQPPEGSAVKRI